ncbi:MAG: peptidase [Burkholderiales bacterium RIFCSPHIGHO2_12_FULL_69_20]|nr:MAG: peptidase [Burkholderiales bacterium RIFCSPHIGHO2_12_FULL_69_20]
MFEKVVPVNRDRHAGKKIREITGFEFAAKFHIAYVTMHEFARAAAVYPIVFVEDKEKDAFRPVALLGLDAGENLFVGANGKWEASYVPAIIRRYPFALAGTGTEGQFTICVDEGSDLVSDTEGSAMFDEKGEPTQVIENVKRYLAELQQMDVLTHEFAKAMTELNMLTPLNMRVRENDRVKNIAGCWVVNEERLNGLSNERFLELRAKRYLPAIYAQLISLAQIERLMSLKEKRSGTGAAGAA